MKVINEQLCGELCSGRKSWGRVTGIVVILTLALILRLIAASKAFPVSGDATHFVQHGIELANGNLEGLSTYWSMGMVLIAALAYSLKLSPLYALQYTAVFTGVLLILPLMLLAYKIFRKWNNAIITGLIAATNPTLIQYSTTGLSEIPYVALLLSAIFFIYKWLVDAESKNSFVFLGFFILGLGSYFKGIDSYISAFVVLFFGIITLACNKRFTGIKNLFFAFILFLLVILPLCTYTYKKDRIFAPAAKFYNIAVGDYLYDSNAYRSIKKPFQADIEYLSKHGFLSYLWKNKTIISKRWIKNAILSVTRINQQLLTKNFQVRLRWAAPFWLFGILFLYRRRTIHFWCFPALLMVIPIAAICLCFVHERILVPSLPFAILLFSDLLTFYFNILRKNLFLWCIFAVVFIFFLTKSVFSGIEEADSDWPAKNLYAVGKELLKYADEEDTIMAPHAQVAISFYKKHPLKYIELPYASIEETEDYCQEKNVTIIVISNSMWKDWPIHKIFQGAELPPNWKLIKEIKFKEDKSKGYPAESYFIFRRS